MYTKKQTKSFSRLIMWMLAVLFVMSMALSMSAAMLHQHVTQTGSRQPFTVITDCSGICPEDNWGSNG